MTQERQESPLLKVRENQFSNVITKLRNRNLGNDTAWQEAQPLFVRVVDDYPSKQQPYLNILRRIFDLRRDDYLGKMARDRRVPSDIVRELVEALPIEEQDKIIEAIVCIRDLFNKQPPQRGSRPIKR